MQLRFNRLFRVELFSLAQGVLSHGQV
ncbi:MAG: hypothetical protein RJA39_214, partial [Pseudomonadota bacterium]